MSTERTRRITLAVAGALALAVLPVAAAQADPTPVGIGPAGTSEAYRAYFHVTAWTDAPGATITGVTATLHDGSEQAAVPALTTSGDGHWSTPSPLTLVSQGGTVPHFGRWQIDVTATDSAGNTDTRTDAGTVDFTLAPSGFDAGNGAQLAFSAPLTRSVHAETVTSTLFASDPVTWAQNPLPGETVTVASTEQGPDASGAAPQSFDVTTDEHGRFTTPAFDVDAGTRFTATVHADDEQAHGSATGTGSPVVSTVPAVVTATASAHRVLPGQRLGISGTVRLGSATGAPVPNSRVVLRLSTAPDAQATVVTGGDGRFTGSVVAIPGSYTTWSATSADPYLAAQAASGPVIVPDESSYTGVRIALNANGTTTASGTLDRTYVPNQAIYNAQTTYLQRSPDGRTGWTNLARAQGTYGVVSVKGGAYADGWYRLYHPTTDELAATATTPVHLHRTVTRVAGNDARPKSIRKGGTLTVSGTLQQYVSGWHAMPGQRVGLYFAKGSSHSFGYVTAGRTDAHGRITLHAKAAVSGRWSLHYFGDTAHFDSTPNGDYVTVR